MNPAIMCRLALRTVAGIATATVIVGCDVRSVQNDGPPTWALDATPVISVGDVGESDSAVFARVTDARRLPSGVLVVADGGAQAVLLFDSTGTQFAKLGRRGRGPGEFSGSLSLAARGTTAVSVWDPSQTRWSEVRTDSASVTTLSGNDGDAAWMHVGVLVRGETSLVPAWVPPLLATLSDSLTEIRFGFIDETALLWVNRDAALSEWVAYAGNTSVGTLKLPAGFRATQFREREVVGVLSDSLGLERVVVYKFARPDGVIADRTPATAPAPDSTMRSTLIAAMRTSVMAQEMAYASRNSYTMRADSLTFTMPPNTRFKILSADNRGWSGAGWVPATGFTCGMFVGAVPPRGWSEGAPRCGW